MKQKGYEALLLITIFLNLAMPAALGLVTGVASSVVRERGYDLVPPLTQFSSEASALNFTISFPLPRPGPVVGEITVLVIAVEFKDYNHTLSIEEVADNTIGQLNKYYSTVSYGAASISGKVAGWVRVPHTMSQYGYDNGPFIDDLDGDGYPDSWRLLKDALPIIAQEVDVKAYQQILILHAGYGQESSRKPNDIWSVTYIRWTTETKYGTFERFAVVPEMEDRGLATVGVYTHEFGHLLGLPDLYSYTNEQVGPWDLMARGAWNGKPLGSSPAEMIAWNRIFLGWITPDHILNVTRQTKVNATVNPIELPSSGVQAIMVPTLAKDSKHYYLIEVRQKIGYDAALPSSGVLISYIDETKSNPVRIMDAVQTTSSLDDAPFQAGQKYLDAQNSLVISVASTDGSSFSVVVDTLAPTVDVAVEGLTLDPPTIHPNNTATLNVEVANEGTLKAKTFTVAVYLNGTLFSSRKLTLDPAESEQFHLLWTPKTVGTYYFEVIMDPEKVLSETNRENNAKMLRVVVGYTLTLEVRPQDAGVDLQWWLIVNGVNETYVGVGEFQIGVLPGSNTLQIQPTIYMNPSARCVFRQWSDGVTDNPRTISVSSDMFLSANFNSEYLLSLEPNGGATTPSGWYGIGTPVTITATSPTSLVENQSRYVFVNWTGDIESDSTIVTVTMDRPYNVVANWKPQYYLRVESSYGVLGGGWYDANAEATVSLSSTVLTDKGTRYLFVQWSGDLSGVDPNQSITMSGPKFVSAMWVTQYELRIESEHGHTAGAGWYDPNTQVTYLVDTLSIESGNGTRRVFVNWSGDASGSAQQSTIVMDTPKVIEANWSTEYRVVFAVNGVRNGTTLTIVVDGQSYRVKTPETVTLWYNPGSSVSFSANATASEAFRQYVLADWKNSTGGPVKSPQTILEPETYTASYRELSLFPCIIATVTFGSEATPEVQFLRGFRDHLVVSTRAGSAFMTAFNMWYYSFSPQVANFIASHDTTRTPMRVALYPLIGILELSSVAYSVLAFSPEFAVVTSGIVASALIGLVYLTPIAFFLVRLLPKRRIRGIHVLKGLSISFLATVAALMLGELTGSLGLLVVGSSGVMLTVLVSVPLLFSFLLLRVWRHVTPQQGGN